MCIFSIFRLFDNFASCIAGKMFERNQRNEIKGCMGNLQVFFERHGRNLTKSFPQLASFRISECLGKTCKKSLDSLTLKKKQKQMCG